MAMTSEKSLLFRIAIHISKGIWHPRYNTKQEIVKCNFGVKGSRLGRSGAAMLPWGGTGGPREGVSYSPGVTDALYSLSTLKTVCAWRRAIPYER